MFKRSARFRPTPKRRSFGFLSARWKKIGLVLLIIFFLSGIGWGIYSVKTNFSIQLDELSCANESQVQSSLEKQQIKFYWLQSQEIERKLREEFPCINEARIERQFPNRVAVTLSGRHPVAVFRIIQKFLPSPPSLEQLEATASTIEAKPSPSPQVSVAYGEAYLLDDKGVAFLAGTRDNLPQLNFVTPRFNIGDSIGVDRIKRILAIWQYFQKQGLSISDVELEGDRLSLKSGSEIVFSVGEDLERQGASLQLILKQAKMNSKSVVKIDLRFDNPVVTYAPEKR